MNDPWLLSAAAGLLLLAAGAFAAAEVALLSVRPARIEALLAEGRPGARRVRELQQDPAGIVLATVAARTLCLVAAALASGVVTGAHLEPRLAGLGVPWARAVSLLLSAFAVASAALVLGRLLPRMVAVRNRDEVARYTAWAVAAFAFATRWWSAALVAATDLGLRLLGFGEAGRRQGLAPDALLALLRRGVSAGERESREWELIRGVFRFSDTPVRRLMVPRTKLAALERGASPEEVARCLVESGHSRLPVYRETLDDVVGLVYASDALARLGSGEPLSIQELLRPVSFVAESKPAGVLLNELRRTRSHLAIVIDEHGSVTGVVTMRDLVEQIVGEISDPGEAAEPAVERLGEGSLLVDGALPVAELRERHGIQLPESEEYDTVGGLLLQRLGALPRGGELVVTERHRLRVVRVARNRIAQVRIDAIRGPSPPTS